MRILATLIEADEGSATVAGHDVRSNPRAVRAAIGLTGQYAAVDERLTGRENLHLLSVLHGLSRTEARRTADTMLDRFELTSAANRVVRGYSGGMRRRLDLASSLIGHPSVLFLDEPTTGLDPHSRNELWSVVRDQVNSGVTVLLTTQYLEEADQLARDIVVIDGGEVAASGTPAELKQQVGGERVAVRLPEADAMERVLPILTAHATGIPTVDEDGRGATVTVGASLKAVSAIANDLAQAQITVDDFGVHHPTLDDVFLAFTNRDAMDDSIHPHKFTTMKAPA